MPVRDPSVLVARRARSGRRSLVLLSAVVLLLAAVPALADEKPKLSSEWTPAPIVVDGANTEWKTLHSLGKNLRLSIGVRNNDRYLYVALITSDSITALQALTQGLVVWVDVDGGTRKRFGFAYPVGGGVMALNRERRGDEEAGVVPADEDAWARLLSEPSLMHGVLIGKDKDDRRPLALGEQQSVLAKIGHAQGMLVYELAFALAKAPDTPDGLGVKPGAVVGIGVETPDPTTAGSLQGRERGGTSRRGGGARDPDEDVESRRNLFLELKPIKAWTTIKLASRPQ